MNNFPDYLQHLVTTCRKGHAVLHATPEGKPLVKGCPVCQGATQKTQGSLDTSVWRNYAVVTSEGRR